MVNLCRNTGEVDIEQSQSQSTPEKVGSLKNRSIPNATAITVTLYVTDHNNAKKTSLYHCESHGKTGKHQYNSHLNRSKISLFRLDLVCYVLMSVLENCVGMTPRSHK